MKTSSPKHQSPAIVATVISLPLNRKGGRGLGWTGRSDTVQIHAYFHSVPNSCDYARRIGSSTCVPEICEVELSVDLAFVKNVPTRNVKDGFLRQSRN